MQARTIITGVASLSLFATLAPHQTDRLTSAPATARAEPDSFTIYKLQRPVGSERFSETILGDSAVMAGKVAFHYIGTDVALTTHLVTSSAGQPRSLTLNGALSTQTPIDARVTVTADTAIVTDNGQARIVRVSPWSFPVFPYPPPSLEDRLIRHWGRLGRPTTVPLLPEGIARFERRGRDTVGTGSTRAILDRYSVQGLLWGRQTIWVDERHRLIAAMGGDAELDRLEAIRAGFEPELARFVARSVDDGLADLAAAARAITPIRSGRYALVSGRVITGTDQPPGEDAVVMVADGRIVAVGGRETTIPPNTPVVDVKGATILAGLWDMHGHLEQVDWVPALLAAGVTTVRDCGNEFELIVGLQKAVAAGRAVGPRILMAGVVDGGAHALGVVTADTPEEARVVVRRYHGVGAKQIKVYQSLKPELVAVVAEEAHRLGMPVTGHVPTGMTALQFVEAGADQINHLNFVTAVLREPPVPGQAPKPLDLQSPKAQASLAIFKKRGLVLDPTLARAEMSLHPRGPAYATLEPGLLKAAYPLRYVVEATGLPDSTAARVRPRFDRSLRLVNEIRREGIPIVLGSDLALPGHGMLRELELAVRGGMTPLEAIQAATIVPARAMGMEAESGTVEAGKRADLVIVDGNPLADISAIRRTRYVVTGGRMFAPAPLWKAAEFLP